MKRRSRCSLAGGAARAALVPAAAFAVHQLRYLLTYGSHAGVILDETGHSYLHSVVPWIVLLVGLSAGGFLVTLGRILDGRPHRTGRGLGFLTLWATCAACLIAVFCAQEFLEGVFAFGHAGGLIGIFGYGGWWAIPAAVGVALVLATILHGARHTLALAAHHAGSHGMTPRRLVERLGMPRPRRLRAPLLVPVSAGWSDRGPPLWI